MKHLICIVHKLENILLVLCLVYIIVMVLVGVILRYSFSTSIMGSDELIGYLVVFLGMMGSAVTIRDNENICLDAIVLKMPTQKQKYLYVPIQILIICILAFYIFCSAKFAVGNMDVNSPMNRISMGIPYGSMTISLIFMLFEQIVFFVTRIKNHMLCWDTQSYNE
ncbi:TRAP transporter small permease [Enterocloster bolteae]|uniref:TRAP transporter small permease n=1 Tax=Enterocloster bolteae TaxID=208479 RepID=UPI00210B041E|nr:TRAP transporter small permease [Enterocloster bolteae]MCQ5141855.1 TRAP transporter small permease [Enterocloster bolteae]